MIDRRIKKAADKIGKQSSSHADYIARVCYAKLSSDVIYVHKTKEEWVDKLHDDLRSIDAMLEEEEDAQTINVLSAAWRESVEDILATMVLE
jgi:hypothetical protein